MRNSEKVLNGLSKHSLQVNYKFKGSNMTEGSDGKTIDGMSLTRIADLIDLLRKETYQPKPARRVYIPKKNAKMRLLGGPSFDGKLV